MKKKYFIGAINLIYCWFINQLIMVNFNKYFPFPLKEQQQKVFKALCDFFQNPDSKIFILRGYAGTGKTTLIGGFIKKLNNDAEKQNENDRNTEYPFHVLASTGRAAKVLSDKTNAEVKTIHSLIYKFANLSDDVEKYLDEHEKSPEPQKIEKGQFLLVFEAQTYTGKQQILYIIDESSMISDKKNPSTSNAVFGNGDLLGDLFKYDENGKFIFVGDPCQLPPVNQKESPALEPDHLRNKYNMHADVYTLTEILRQKDDNDILICAFNLRKLWQSYKQNRIERPNFTPLPLKGYQNLKVYPSELSLVTQYIETVKRKGYDYTTLICNSNKECNTLSKFVRETIHGKREFIIVGDLLLVTQNNYIVDLVNGDLITVKEIGDREFRAGLRFAHVEVEELSSKKVFRLLLLEDLLMNGQATLNEEQHKNMIIDFAIRMNQRNIKPKSEEFFELMLKDPYLNALRTSYGYALTCHKSQGGEWDEVFLYLEKSLFARRGTELYQWAYTAVTRAKSLIHIADNWIIR